jgi:hypothetical protein
LPLTVLPLPAAVACESLGADMFDDALPPTDDRTESVLPPETALPVLLTAFVDAAFARSALDGPFAGEADLPVELESELAVSAE